MATPTARLVIDFEANTSGIDAAKGKLEGLQNAIEKDSKALKELSESMARLKGTAEVARWEALPKDIAKADNEIVKLSAKMAKLKSDFEKAPAGKGAGILEAQGQTASALETASKRASALRAEQEKLGKSSPVKMFEDMRIASDKLKGTLGKNQTELSRMGGSMEKAKSGLDNLGSAAKATNSPLGGMIDSFKALKDLGPAAKYAAVAIVLVALATGFAIVLGKALAFTIAMSDAARSARLLREANASALVTASGLKDITNGILAKTNAQEESVAGLAAEYSRLNLSMRTVEKSTSAITMANSVLGAGVGSTLKGLIDRGTLMKRFWLNAMDLRGTGLSLRDVSTQLAKQMKIGIGAAEAALRDGTVKLEDGVTALDAAMEAKFGKIARAQMLALPVQLERVKKNLANLFSGANVEKFLEKMDGALGLFKETEVVGKALKTAFTAIFQPLINGAGDSFPLLEGFIYGATIALQKLTITGLRVAIMAKKMFGESIFKDLDLLQVGIYAGMVAFAAFGVVLGALAALFTALMIPVAIIGVVLGAIASAIAAIGAGVLWVVNTIMDTVDELVDYMIATDTSISDAIEGILDAIIDGVTGGIVDVATAFKDLALAGVKAFKDAIQMKSPPRVFVRIGEAIPDAVAGGVDRRTPQVATALSRMAKPEDVDVEGAAGKLSGQGSTNEAPAVYTLNYYGSGSRSDAVQFGQWFVDELEYAKRARAR
jgi:hypothetical protein